MVTDDIDQFDLLLPRLEINNRIDLAQRQIDNAREDMKFIWKRRHKTNKPLRLFKRVRQRYNEAFEDYRYYRSLAD